MKNQEDIGNAVAAYYGSGAGQQLTTLLKEHAVYDHILHMSDTLADGIVKQFPEKFSRTPIVTRGVR